MDIKAINSVDGMRHELMASTILQKASDEVLDTLKGIQYKQALIILQLAIDRLEIRTKVL